VKLKRVVRLRVNIDADDFKASAAIALRGPASAAK
jgi:hypothetical protein